MNILLVGIHHGIQGVPGNFPNPRKNQFEQALRQIVRDRSVDFIGEETYPDRETIAKRIANSFGIRWEPIEMSLKAREELGIAEEQNSRPNGNETRVASDGIREEFMAWKTLKIAGKAQSIVIVCGRLHTDALAETFRKAGHEVDKHGLGNREWYEPGT